MSLSMTIRKLILVFLLFLLQGCDRKEVSFFNDPIYLELIESELNIKGVPYELKGKNLTYSSKDGKEVGEIINEVIGRYIRIQMFSMNNFEELRNQWELLKLEIYFVKNDDSSYICLIPRDKCDVAMAPVVKLRPYLRNVCNENRK